MNRTDAVEYLQAEYPDIAVEAGITVHDTVGGVKLIIDRALRMIGIDEADLVTVDVEYDGQPGFELALDYEFLRRAVRRLAPRKDVSYDAPNTSIKDSQLYDHVKALYEEARSALEVSGVVQGEGFQAGYMDMDFLEPETEDA